MNRYVCIHGHFYQPPRENPWLETIELQESAHPYHDWNTRITAQCYGPNSCSRIMDAENHIIDVVNNYGKISFNFGPTLLSWLEKENPEIYAAILEADRQSMKAFSGHGSAMAQAYNHMIMPLANARDKMTQVLWGIKDFEARFKRRPEGMWLPEAAVDLETLDVLAQCDIKFTILAPRQANRVRKIGGEAWQSVADARIDTKMPYLCRLPSGRSIALFFYDGPVAQGIAFEGLLKNGETLSRRLNSVFASEDRPQLVHIATDGESYGHHHIFGDMALAFALFDLESKQEAKITIYGEFLEKFPPTHEVEIFENSSWSCVHGIERWRANCGCNSGGSQAGTQEWRGPLRGAMDWLRDTLTPLYEGQLSPLLRDPWLARNDYLTVVNDRSPENVAAFLARHAVRTLEPVEVVKVLKVLEMARNAMLMYTSCGWFFNDVSGIETVQTLRYAARAIQLARDVAGIDLESTFTQLLERAPCNYAKYTNGAEVYANLCRPAILDLLRVGVHFAVSSLFKEYPESASLYSYSCKTIAYEKFAVGKQKAVVGRVFIRSTVTREEGEISFAVTHLGDHNVVGGARFFMGDEAFAAMQAEIKAAFLKSQIPEVIYLIDKHFDAHNYSLWNLFKDDQCEIIDSILRSVNSEVGASFQQIYDHHAPIMEFIRGLGMPLPPYFASVVEFILNRDVRHIFDSPNIEATTLARVLDETKRWAFNIDTSSLKLLGEREVHRLMAKWAEVPEDLELLTRTTALLKTMLLVFGDMYLWREQNLYIAVTRDACATMKYRAATNDDLAQRWLEGVEALGAFLKVRLR